MPKALLLLLLQACPQGDLAYGKPAVGTGLNGAPSVVTDGILPAEGTTWAPVAVGFGEDGQVTIDLGAPQTIRALALQGDSDDIYYVQGSPDTVTWREIWAAPAVPDEQGLRTRSVQFPPQSDVRYLRVRGSDGDGFFRISELRAYCGVPMPWPPVLVAQPGPRLQALYVWWTKLDQARMTAIKGFVALLGTLLLVWRLFQRPAGADGHLPVQSRLLAALGAISFLCFWNLGHYHFDRYANLWEQYHYYIGSKYFRELGYTRLYRCAAVADAEMGTSHEKLRNLVTNHLEAAASTMAEPSSCKRYFSEARWEEYKRDISWFRGQLPARTWERVHHDHGYNATPVWGVAASTLANLLPASKGAINFLGLVDSMLLCGMWAVVWWAFGWRTLCVALLYWGTDYPALYWWNGGAFLRMDWLAASIVGICLVRRGRLAAGGFALTLGALLRIFPGLIVMGHVLKALARMVHERRLTLSSQHKRFALGCVAAVVVFVPLSAWVEDGGRWPPLNAWFGSAGEVGFVQNTQKHLDTPLTNNMGLKTVLSWEESTRAARMWNSSLEDPNDDWKAARRRVFAERRVFYVVLLGSFLFLLARAAAKHEDWVALVLGVGLIPIASELTCYYYSFMLAFAFLWTKRRSRGVAAALLAVSALSCALPRVFPGHDDAYTCLSIVFVLFVVGATAYLGALPGDPEGAAVDLSEA